MVGELTDLISPVVLKNYTATGACELGTRDLESLLFHPDRFDLMAKLVYGEAYLTRRARGWQAHLYREHIRAFNNFDERDGSGKQGAEAFFAEFHKVLDSPTSDVDSLNVIPVTTRGMILDGSHRLVRAHLRNEPLNLVYFEPRSSSYDYRFFIERGLQSDVADEIAFQYGQRNPRAHCLLLFPSASEHLKRAEQVIRKWSAIFFRKVIYWTDRAPHNVTASLYYGEPWLGSFRNCFRGAGDKFKHCFTSKEPMVFYVLTTTTETELLSMKQELRDAFGINNHSLHTSLNHAEKIRMLQVFLNENTVKWFNSAAPRYFPTFHKAFVRYQQTGNEAGSCLVGSSVFAAYGVRDARDLDCVIDPTGTSIPVAERHNEYLKQFMPVGRKVSDLIDDPRLHFYYFGTKIISLEFFNRIRWRRREWKDWKDQLRLAAFSLRNRITSSLFRSARSQPRACSVPDATVSKHPL